MNNVGLLLLLVGLLVSDSLKQFKADMSAIKKRLGQLEYYEAETDFKIYNVETGVLFESATGFFVKHGEYWYNRIDVIESVHTPKYNLMIDNENKYIVLDTATKFSSNMNALLMSVADTMDFSSEVNITSSNSGMDRKQYDVRFKKDYAAISQFVFEYNPKTLLPAKYVVFLRERMQGRKPTESVLPRFEMEFRRFSTVATNKAVLTALSNYIKKNSSGKWEVANNKYRDYKIKKTF